MFDIALITCAAWPRLHPEDALLCAALQQQGLSSAPVIWDAPDRPEPEVGWLMRTAWDYTFKPEDFATWLTQLPPDRTWNSPALMLKNMHKGYLLDLAARGAPVVPTELFLRGTGDLPSHRPGRWVAKPAISAGSRGALEGPWASVGPHLVDLVVTCDALLQPYYEAVESYRERSFIFVDGKFQHAVLRTVALLEGRGVDRLHNRVTPTQAELEAARRVLDALDEVPLYARVDLIPDRAGQPVLLELELVEPQLFLLEAPETAAQLALALKRRLAC